MTTETKVRSTVEPKSVSIDAYHARVYYNIVRIEENISAENEFIGYEYDIDTYTKDEYIEKMIAENAVLEESLTNTQLALCDIYEMMEV